MKTLVTHINPHLDDICALWLFKRQHPDFAQAEIKFIPTNPQGGKTLDGAPVDSNPEIVHAGVCRGRFDEHRGLPDECSTTLVWQYLLKQNLAPQDPLTHKALQKIIDWVLLDDTGRLKEQVLREFSVPAILAGRRELGGTSCDPSLSTTRLGFELLDCLLISLKADLTFEKDWETRIEFETQWGMGAAVESNFPSQSFAYARGFTVLVSLEPKRGYRAVMGKAESEVDLTSAYRKVKKLDPDAGWYLHQSKKLLLCGSAVAPEVVLSTLSLKELIDLVEKKKPVALV